MAFRKKSYSCYSLRLTSEYHKSCRSSVYHIVVRISVSRQNIFQSDWQRYLYTQHTTYQNLSAPHHQRRDVEMGRIHKTTRRDSKWV